MENANKKQKTDHKDLPSNTNIDIQPTDMNTILCDMTPNAKKSNSDCANTVRKLLNPMNNFQSDSNLQDESDKNLSDDSSGEFIEKNSSESEEGIADLSNFIHNQKPSKTLDRSEAVRNAVYRKQHDLRDKKPCAGYDTDKKPPEVSKKLYPRDLKLQDESNKKPPAVSASTYSLHTKTSTYEHNTETMDLESEEDIIYVLDITKAFNNDMLPTNRTYKHDISRFYTLHHGIESGDLEEEDLFKLLEDNEDSANKTDAKGNYPIAYACNNVKYKKFAMELTTRYPDAVKNQDWTNRSNPLHVAVQWRRKQVISLIRLNANCLINYLDNENNGVTPLQQLCKVNNWSNENDKVLTMLLKFPNLLINKKSPENGYTALHYACMKYNWPAINLLLGHNKINIYNVDNERNPPFLKLIEDDDDCVTYQQILSIEAFLKNKTIAILQVGAKTRNALHLACIYGSPMMFGKIFLLKRSDINLGDVNGDTPLHLACAYNNKYIVNDLIKEPDIMIDNQNVHGQTPFHVACLNGSIECITMLLSMNEIKSYELLNEHTVDHNGSTVLHDVVCTGNYDVRLGTLKLLLGKYSMFANKKIKNNNGFTPLELAIIESLKAKARDSEHGIKVFEEIINLLK